MYNESSLSLLTDTLVRGKCANIRLKNGYSSRLHYFYFSFIRVLVVEVVQCTRTHKQAGEKYKYISLLSICSIYSSCVWRLALAPMCIRQQQSLHTYNGEAHTHYSIEQAAAAASGRKQWGEYFERKGGIFALSYILGSLCAEMNRVVVISEIIGNGCRK